MRSRCRSQANRKTCREQSDDSHSHSSTDSQGGVKSINTTKETVMNQYNEVYWAYSCGIISFEQLKEQLQVLNEQELTKEV